MCCWYPLDDEVVRQLLLSLSECLSLSQVGSLRMVRVGWAPV